MRFLLAWELGSSLGHTTRLRLMAAPLLAAGHRVDFVLQDLSAARAVLGDLLERESVRLWQAPVWLAGHHQTRHPISYAELLLEIGYEDAPRLTGLALAWRGLFDAIRPDLMLADHSPTALLAARGQGFACANVGTGYSLPPLRTPMPQFAIWEPADPERVAESERRVLDTCNAVLRALRQPPMSALAQLLSVDEMFLLTWREIDHYGTAFRSADTNYRGVPVIDESGVAPDWPPGPGPRVFAYLHSGYAPTTGLLQQLAAAPWRTLAHVSGLPAGIAAQLESTQLRISSALVDARQSAQEADVLVSHGNFGTVCNFLRAGAPSVLLPRQAEQLLLAVRLTQTGIGLLATEPQAADETLALLRRVIEEPSFGQAAQGFAKRYGGATADVALDVARRCMQLAAR